jgi:drug/metabolite transporter (DMT)-like permease
VEVLFAQVVSRRLLDQSTSAREWLGMALIIGGVALLMIAQ